MSEWTKGKWSLSEIHNFSGTLVCWVECDGKRLFSIRENLIGCSEKQFKANARRICQCVNSHDALVEACEKAQFVYDYTISRTPTGLEREKLTERNILRLQAIALAEAEKE